MPFEERAGHIDPSEVQRKRQIESYLHEHIPLSYAMGVRVKLATLGRVELSVPWEPNINHHKTVFGGSAAAAATLAAWTLVRLRLEHAGADAQVVIQRSCLEYRRPITGDFEAASTFDDREAWARFERALARRGRARLAMTARLVYDRVEVGTFAGDFVALRNGLG